jgi:rhodanese-related sulfurtransferase
VSEITAIDSSADRYEQFARIGKAVASARRVGLLDLLCQGERSVEALANTARLSVTNTSQHLQILRAARARLDELPAGLEIVAYCRGPYCLLASDALELLREHGFGARRLEDGFPEWRLAGLPIAAEEEE